MPTIQQSGTHSRRPVLLRLSSDLAVLILLFGAMLSAWALLAVAAVALIGLTLYAWLSDDPDRHRYALVAVGAALGACIVSITVALLR